MAGFFYPPVCQLCLDEPGYPRAGYVGDRCRRGVRWVRPPYCDRCGLPYAGAIRGPFECENCRGLSLAFERARAAAVAEGVLLDVLHRYKYGRQLWFEPFLVGLLTAAAGPPLRGGGWDVIVPVPLHAVKAREREFDQAARLAMGLGRAVGLPVALRAVRRVRYTETQTRLSRGERLVNVAGAFAARPGGLRRGARVVLVDDVMTTGATTSDCARALLASGAAAVSVWTVARGL